MSLRCLFIVTAYIAVVSAGLAFPSLAWVVGFSLANVGVAVYAAQRAATSPDARPFWLGYLAGVGALFAGLNCVKQDVVRVAVAEPVAGWMHGSFSPLESDQILKFSNFLDISKLALLIAVPFVVAVAMKPLLRKSKSEA